MEGIVIKAAGNLYKVKYGIDQYIDCRIKGKLRVLDLKSTNPVTVGDHVLFELDSRAEVGAIFEVMERKNYIIRKSTNLSRQFHVIAANVDQALLIVALKDPETNTDFIDRYLAAAEAFRIPVVIIFNKTDLYTGVYKEKLDELTKLYSGIGYTCLHTSVAKNLNIDAFGQLLKGKISVVNGNSGVGKSSLINAVDSSFDLKIGEISDYHKSGKHTTSYSEMFTLKNDSYIIDTPGIKGFGLFDLYKEELYHFFPEIFKLSADCKFYNCTHIHEPHCAIIRAVDTGEIALSRYTSYFNIYNDDNKKHRG